MREAQAWWAATVRPGHAAERAWGTGWRSLSAAPLCVRWQLAPAAPEGLRTGLTEKPPDPCPTAPCFPVTCGMGAGHGGSQGSFCEQPAQAHPEDGPEKKT